MHLSLQDTFREGFERVERRLNSVQEYMDGMREEFDQKLDGIGKGVGGTLDGMGKTLNGMGNKVAERFDAMMEKLRMVEEIVRAQHSTLQLPTSEFRRSPDLPRRFIGRGRAHSSRED